MSAASATNGSAPQQAPAQGSLAALVAERPELAVGAAFVGGLLAAIIIRRLGS